MTKAVIEVHTPQVPNFLRFKNTEGSIHIADVSDECLLEIGAAWTDKLLEHAERMRKHRAGTKSALIK